MRLLLTLLALLPLAASAHFHTWEKVNSYYATDAYGNRVQVCTWVCRVDWRNKHQVQTQGMGMCPYPSNY